VITEINRYSRSYQFVVDDAAAASTNLAGRFNVADPRGLIWALRKQPGLSVDVDRHLVRIRSSAP
jgi:ferric-dicitrate binding protein FerR (iron transport regulator)